MLRNSGVSNRCPEGEYVSPLEKRIVHIQTECDVDYAGPLAGWRKGSHNICGNRILVTTEAALITPEAGECPNIDAVIDNLFLDGEHDQRPYVLGWLKVALEALYARRLRPGQALIIAGERGCGKSLFQKIVDSLLGGRSAKPYRYMSGATPFNSELFGAEHLMIEDEVATTDGRKRRDFGAKIKDFTVNEIHSCHPKNRNAISLKPFWRITGTLNDEPENLMVLPPIDESLVDKLILLKANKRPMPMNTDTLEGRNQFWEVITSELPAFIYRVLQYPIPAELQSERFGVTHFHHPQLIEALDELSDENKLLSLIDSTLFAAGTVWEGTAEELKRVLCESAAGYEAKHLLAWNNATGTYLGRLAKRYPKRISPDRDSRKRFWVIQQDGNRMTP